MKKDIRGNTFFRFRYIFLISILISAQLFIALNISQAQAAESDLEILKERFTDELLEPSVDEQEVQNLISTIREDGTWPGINYEDTSRTAFEHSIHLDNMVNLGRAYKKPGSSFKGNSDLKQVIWKALDFWIEHDFICENWWWNQIGTPERIGNLLLIMDEDLTDEQKEKTDPIVGRANLDAWGARPGGDLIKIAGILGKHALFKGDIDVLEKAVEAIAGEIGFAVDRGDTSDVRGLQTDFSFHHRHDRVTSTITYGQGFASYFVDWAKKVNGTEFEFSDESIQLIVDFYLDGINGYMAFGKYPDPGGRNRGITRLGALNPRSPELPRTLLQITNYREDELEAIVQIREGEREPDLRKNTFFWNTEYFSHQRPHYFTSVRMYSSRNHSVEVPYNSEGLKNHHLADGYNFITRTGEEYIHIFPVWDWQKIPGTTVVQKPSLPDPDEVQQAGLTDFVGGVTDGTYGAAVFDFESPLDPLSARKSWFFFDDEFVALGADIRSESDYTVATTLNQSLLNGDVIIATTENESVLERGEHNLEEVLWVHHDETAYLFPVPTAVKLENRQRNGEWKDINEQTWAFAQEEVRKDVFTLWIDHGISPEQAGYKYIVVPGIEAAEVENYHSSFPIKIVANQPEIQAVKHTGLGMSQIVFYEPGDIEISDSITITAKTSGQLMVATSNDTIEKITVSDPSRKLDSFQFTVTAPVEIDNDKWSAEWDENGGYSRVSVTLPDGHYAGQSVSYYLSR
jgi:chondroitin AC lyase